MSTRRHTRLRLQDIINTFSRPRSFARVVPIIAIAALLGSGCIYSREIAHTGREIERANPGLELDRKFTANLGPVAIRLGRFVTGRVRDEDAQRASRYLRSIRRVKVGVYEAHIREDVRLEGIPEMHRFGRGGWQLAARVREDNEDVWLYYRERGQTVTDLYVMVLSEDELVIARVKGSLNRLMEDAVKDFGPFSDWAGVD